MFKVEQCFPASIRGGAAENVRVPFARRGRRVPIAADDRRFETDGFAGPVDTQLAPSRANSVS